MLVSFLLFKLYLLLEREMAAWVEALDAFPEDLKLVPSTMSDNSQLPVNSNS